MDLVISTSLLAASSSHAKTTGSSSTFFIFLILMVAVFWFAVIRPQRKRQQAQQQAGSQIGPGDEVVTVGGILGTVVETEDDRVVLLVAPGIPSSDGGPGQPVEMTFLRQAISRKISAPADVDAAGLAESEEEADLPDEPEGEGR